jgi:hypothetical protein
MSRPILGRARSHVQENPDLGLRAAALVAQASAHQGGNKALITQKHAIDIALRIKRAH